MQATAMRLTGVGASAKKYDVLSALALAGLQDAALSSQRALRFIALITIRYNWANDVLSVGHAELGRLWRVSKRTVIREMDVLRNLGLLVVLRPGRRGAVTTYRIDIIAIRRLAAVSLQDDATGIDVRLAETREDDDTERPAASPSVTLGDTVHPRTPDLALWEAILERLPATISSVQKKRWLVPVRAEQRNNTLHVEADSPFHAAYIAHNYSDALHVAARPLGMTRVTIVVGNRKLSRAAGGEAVR